MKYFIYFIFLCGFGCEAIAMSKKNPAPAPAVIPSQPTQEVTPVVNENGLDALFDLINKSACQKFEYGGKQGRAPIGYLRGLSLTYVKTICAKDSDVYKIGSQPMGDSSKDALAHYGLSPKSESERLSSTFALMIGSNARESSWRPCVGRDVAAKESDVKACLYGGGETCEAGLAQTSYNSIPKEGPLRNLFSRYSESITGCFKAEYYGKTTCSDANWKNHGSNPQAVTFQRLSKECPGFTVESAAIMFRTKRTHYGPLNRKTAEVVPACVSMFESIRNLVDQNPNLCKGI